MTTGTNDFQAFGTGGSANVLSQAAYVALTTLIANGFTSGVAQSNQVNKVLRQAVFGSAALGQIIANTGVNAPDDGNLSTFVTDLLAAISAGTKNIQVYNTAGTFTFTVPAGVTKLDVEGWGGGGGGSGNASGTIGGGGGSGAYGRKLCTVTPGQSITVTIAAAAAGGAAGANNGQNGGTCSFGAFLSIAGGTGGTTNSGTNTAGGAAPTADVAIIGGVAPGSITTGSNAFGLGASAPRGGIGGTNSTGGGTPGGWPGAGGGPGYSSGGAVAGGAGATGGFIVRW